MRIVNRALKSGVITLGILSAVVVLFGLGKLVAHITYVYGDAAGIVSFSIIIGLMLWGGIFVLYE